MLKRTPLYDKHVLFKAKMVSFAGWEMPVYYPAGILAEHKAVRTSCGIFDIGHMGLLKIPNPKSQIPKAEEFLNRITTNDASKLTEFSSQYSILCNEEGGVVDDILVYRLPESHILVVNASNTDKDLKWIKERAEEIEIQLLNDQSLLAIQGPKSPEVIQKLLGSMPQMKKNHCAYFGDILVSRTGYTGEDGFELFVPKEKIGELWDKLIEMKIQPCGLGARDTLRLEAGLPLYGHEYNDTTTPLEAGYGWAVKFDKKDFIGLEKLAKEKEEGAKKKLVGIVLSSRAVAREGFKVYDRGEFEIGAVTSGTFSPTLEKPIALAYISKEYQGRYVDVEIRGQRIEGEIVSLPFFSPSPRLRRTSND